MPTTPPSDALAYYRDWVAYRQDYLRVPGVQAAVVHAGQPVLTIAAGLADLAGGVPVTDATLFRVASHSKTFTAVAVMQLVEQGRLRLDDRVGDLLPDLAGSALAGINVRELLSHSGGVIRDSLDGDFWQLGRPFPDAGELQSIAGQASAAVFEPNETFKYTNIGFGLLGAIIEATTGAGYAEQLHAAVVAPLGLVNAGPELEPSRAAELATGYSSLAYAPTRTPIDHVDTRALAAATGWYATATELAAFYATLLPDAPDDRRLLSANSTRQLRRPVWEVTPGQQHYGLGLILATVGASETFGHSGGYPGHITRTMADPARSLVVSVLTNAIDGPAEQLAAGLLHLLELAEGATHAPAPDAGRFTGRFGSLWGVYDVAALGGRLFQLNPTAVKPTELAVPVEQVDGDTLRIVGGTGLGSVGELIRYRRDTAGRVVSLRGGSGMTATPLEEFTLPDRVRLP